MSKITDISILVVTHNHADYIQALLNSLENNGYSNVYICDANSSDDTVEILKKSYLKNHLLLKNKLEGFSKNNNDLIRHFNLKTKYYLLLNPDLYFENDFIDKLYHEIEKDNSIGIITPQILYPNGKIQTTWKKFPSVLHVIKKRLKMVSSKKEKQLETRNIDWCLGACMLISHVLLKQNNTLLDERFRLYCEDVDICFEAHTKKLKVIGEKSVTAYHHLNELSSKNILSKYNWWNIQSIFKFALKWNFKYLLRQK